jgi:succinate dehydrogenase/fumarate reductase cytochrome b subunit
MGVSLIDKLRGPKIVDMAIFDWAATAAVAVFIGFIAKSGTIGIVAFIILIIIAILVHHCLGIPTMFNAYLGLAHKKDVYDKRQS